MEWSSINGLPCKRPGLKRELRARGGNVSVTILEALQNAELNIDNVSVIGVSILPIAKQQLHNAVTLLEKGYGTEDMIEPLLEQFGDVDDVPSR